MTGSLIGAASASIPAAPFDAPYSAVRVSPERIIRTVAGLRPYRAKGFVVRAEKHGKKLLVHNYGHGGSGVTLAFGSAELALRAAAARDFKEAAVIGAGVIGLTTALALARLGAKTTVYAEHLPPETTSNIAAALWEPASLFRLEAVDEAFLRDFRFAARHSHQIFQRYANNPRYGVRWIRRLELYDAAPARPREPQYEGDDLYPGMVGETDPARWFGFPYTERCHALMIDTDIFLNALMDDVAAAGARIVRRRFESADDVFDLDEKVIFNCTGLGARALFGDEDMRPVRGQLTLLLPQPEIDYGYVHFGPQGLLYMFPRQGAIVLGGTFEQDDWSTEPREADRERMIAGHAAMAARIGGDRGRATR